jgi:hypothetical protein
MLYHETLDRLHAQLIMNETHISRCSEPINDDDLIDDHIKDIPDWDEDDDFIEDDDDDDSDCHEDEGRN